MTEYWHFEKINMYKLLCPHDYKEYKKQHEVSSFKKNEYIYSENEASNKIFLIEKGKVKLGYYCEDGKEVVKTIISRGEIFGEKAVLGELKRHEFAKCLTSDTKICLVGIDTMQDMMRDHKNFALSIYKIINFRFRKLERRLEILLFKDTRTRLIEFIKELSVEYGVELLEGKTEIKHPYTQNDLATLIGTSRPTLNILLNSLKEEGYITFDRKSMILLKEIEI